MLLSNPRGIARTLANGINPTVAYFSMEVGLDSSMPTYAGGLGILAGDLLRAAADTGIPMIGVTLLYRKGYFHQHLDEKGNQTETPVNWEPEDYLEPLQPRAQISLEGRQVTVRAWRYAVMGASGNVVPVYFLDTAGPENSAQDQNLIDCLYGGDDHHRLCQEAVLGMGGIAMLRALGYHDVQVYHMNEGHSALLTVALLQEQAERTGTPAARKQNIEQVREQCVFTTHTPVPAGIDKFPIGMVRQVIGDTATDIITAVGCLTDSTLNMIYLALFFSRYINGVSMRHEQISHGMYPNYPINSVTNGVHTVSWTSEPFRHFYDRYIPEWRHDTLYLRYVISAPPEEIHQAHIQAKTDLLTEIQHRTGINLSPTTLTLGYARRMTPYKRADLLFTDLERLKRIASQAGPLQVIYSGKAHPRDEGGKEAIRKIYEAANALRGLINVVFLEDYDISIARYLCSGVDLWMNTPQKPQEASGTSGMKAALNGVPSLSILDGWWVEGHVEGVTGWSIGEPRQESNPDAEVNSLYHKLENIIVPLYYRQPENYNLIMRSCIALNASYFNTQRMLFQYVEHAYMPYR